MVTGAGGVLFSTYTRKTNSSLKDNHILLTFTLHDNGISVALVSTKSKSGGSDLTAGRRVELLLVV